MYIKLSKVSKSYQEGDKQHQIFEGIDLDIPQGEFVALLGPSGSGKTTLLNLISGIDLPDQGEIIIDGEKISIFNIYFAGTGGTTCYDFACGDSQSGNRG